MCSSAFSRMYLMSSLPYWISCSTPSATSASMSLLCPSLTGPEVSRSKTFLLSSAVPLSWSGDACTPLLVMSASVILKSLSTMCSPPYLL